MMAPLEAMAKAAYDQWITPVKSMHESWEALPEEHRYRMIESQRAALLALAEVDLDPALLNNGYYEYPFEEVLRSIAKQP